MNSSTSWMPPCSCSGGTRSPGRPTSWCAGARPGVGLLEERLQVDHRAADAGQVAAVVGAEAAVLDDQLGARRHAVRRVVVDRVGEVVARDRAGDVRAVVLRVPLGAADAAGALVGPQEVDREHLALRGVDDGAAVAGVGRRQAERGVAEVAHVGVDAGVDEADHLALAEDALIEDRRRLPAADAGLADPDGGVVVQRAPALDVDPEHLRHLGEPLGQTDGAIGRHQHADAGEAPALAHADHLRLRLERALAEDALHVGVRVGLHHDGLHGGVLGGVGRLAQAARDLVLGPDHAGPRAEPGRAPARRHAHQEAVVRHVGVDPLDPRLEGGEIGGGRWPGELDQHVLAGSVGRRQRLVGERRCRAGVDRHRRQ